MNGITVARGDLLRPWLRRLSHYKHFRDPAPQARSPYSYVSKAIPSEAVRARLVCDVEGLDSARKRFGETKIEDYCSKIKTAGFASFSETTTYFDGDTT